MKYELIPIEKLKPLELVFPHHLKNLTVLINKDQAMKYALVVEDKHNIILDGSTRYLFLALGGYKYAPVHFVDYDNPHVRVGTNRVHRMFIDGPVGISKEEVIRRGVTGDLFPPRTTRHFVPFLRPELQIPLDVLGKREPIDLRKYIVDVDIQEEIEHNELYISEINAEVEEIIHYLEESIRTKKYLSGQVDSMRQEVCKRE